MNQWCKTQSLLPFSFGMLGLIYGGKTHLTWSEDVYYISTIKVSNIQLVTVLGPTFNPSQTH